MKSQPISAPLALWLDPETALSPEHSQALQVSGWAVMPVTTLDSLVAQAPDAAVVVLHLALDVTRLKAVQQLLQDAGLSTPVVCRVDRHELDLAVEATQAGALTVLATQDVRPASWLRLLNQINPSAARVAPQPVRNVVFVDPASQHLLALAQKVAQAEVTALLVGPTGSGKEVLARVLHEASGRARGPFVALNCAAMPENLIEDMLFGHEKGAFTGAVKDHRGLFEQAQGGTLFLDEIGELPLQLQAKLLRVLQERTLVRLGGERSIQLDVRVVAATNKNLREAIGQREFREDLYFRLSTFKLRVPPLSERVGDILPLLVRLLARHTQGTQVWRVSPADQGLLMAYAWPGNVRELENVVQRAMVLCANHHIDTEHLMFDDMPDTALLSVAFDTTSAQTPLEVSAVEANPQGLQAAVKHSEQHLIRNAIETSNSRIEAAQKLGISPRTLRYKLAQLRESSPAQLANA